MALDRILARTRADVARRKRETPVSRLPSPAPSPPHSLAAALGGERTCFILECKRASPSAGLIRPDYDPAGIAAIYAPHAAAISVLTEGPFFQGSYDHLRQVRSVVDLPILCKDFIIDPYQIHEARAHGADAVLLMLAVLDDEEYATCTAVARSMGMESLTEVHSDSELRRALALGAEIIGINNRDLRSLRVDLDTVRRLAPRIPADRVIVCESGIRHHGDVVALAPLVNAFLVGTSLMREPDLATAVRRLVYGLTKVCGLTRPQDARAAWEAGATHGGLIFAGESPRRVSEERAAQVRGSAPLHWVGVFVNESPARIAELAARLGLAAVQLHGEETTDDIARLRPLLPTGCQVWKAIRVRNVIPRVADTGADLLLLDTWRSDRRGGTGEQFDWSLLRSVPEPERLILSGGLTPDSAPEAAALGLAGLDVNSGVEEEPGLKNPALIRAFLEARRGSGRMGAPA